MANCHAAEQLFRPSGYREDGTLRPVHVAVASFQKQQARLEACSRIDCRLPLEKRKEMKLSRTTLVAAMCAIAAVPMASQAASNFDTTSPYSAAVDLNFNVVIPSYIFLRVGSVASVNTLVFSPTVAEMEASTAVLPTGGDVSGSDLTIAVRGNVGNMTLAASNLANLVSGGNNIPTSTLTASNPTGSITVPAFGGNISLTAGGNGTFNQAGTWRYTWANPANTVYPPGTYAGTATYTLSAP